MVNLDGVGGKVKEKERIEDALLRETEEEIGVKVKDFEKAALLRFIFPYNKNWNQDVHVFLINSWEGEPKETEEMAPKWFGTDNLPFENMWDDDNYWVSRVLAGEKIKAEFTFKKGEKIEKYNVKKVKEL